MAVNQWIDPPDEEGIPEDTNWCLECGAYSYSTEQERCRACGWEEESIRDLLTAHEKAEAEKAWGTPIPDEATIWIMRHNPFNPKEQ